MKKYLFINILVIGFLIGTYTFLISQEGSGKGRLTGIVIDKDKNPIQGVKITLSYRDFNRTRTTISKKSGRWAFLGLGGGVVRIEAEKEGYNKSWIDLKVSGIKKNPRQTIILSRIAESNQQHEKVKKSKNKFEKAQQLFKDQDFSGALKLYEELLQQKPSLFKIRILIANCYNRLKDYEKAIAEFHKILNILEQDNPNGKNDLEIAKIYAGIGDSYMRQKKYLEAETYFKKSIEIKKDDPALSYNVAEILFAANNIEEAIRYYQLTIEIDPMYTKAYKKLGYTYLNKGDINKALDIMDKLVELAPNSPDAQEVREIIKTLRK